MDEGAAEELLVPMRPVAARVHIKKRSLRNKALSVGFDEKQLQDFVGGFHKRKKKRRKVAQRQLMEKERLRRIGARKQRKLEKELALHGGMLPTEDPQEQTEYGNDIEESEEHTKDNGTVSGTTTYESGDVMITVTTSELSCENNDERPSRVILSTGTDTARKGNLGIKKKPLKEASSRMGKKRRHQKSMKHGQQKMAKKGKGRR